ncbi:MAG TPA: hypothetical protein VG621_01530 [Candidatus Paceibacterota bacterium]|nr:hypothetical protein [Candidatus Paceibacterota bacterium]
MYVATVIPTARGIPFDTLTYYSPEALAPGTLVVIPLGKQIIMGIVVDTLPLIHAKTLVKKAPFSLKKIKQVVGYSGYFSHVVHALQSSALTQMVPLGAIAATVMPSSLFDFLRKQPFDTPDTTMVPTAEAGSESVEVGTTEERVNHYRQLIRSAFAAKKSVYLVAPTIRAVEQWKEMLAKGIQKYAFALHSKSTKKYVRNVCSTLATSDRPVVVCMTPGFFFIPRTDLGHVIIEDESSTLYKTNDRYAIDSRICIHHFCRLMQLHIVWGDTLPRFETLQRLKALHLPRTYVPDKLHLVAVSPYRGTLPQEVIDLVHHAQKKKYRLFIYTHRKGVASLSRCADCGTVVTCPTCALPMVLRTQMLSDGSRLHSFVCTHCGDTLPSSHVCSLCGSWNITPLAIGTESVRDALITHIGEQQVITIDDDLVPESATLEKLLLSIRQKKFVVVVGTTKFLPYIKHIHYTLIPYIDRLLSIPSFRTVENTLRLIMECNEHSDKGVVVFTRTPDFPFIKKLSTQKINTIISDELELRREFGYPPYGVVLKLSLTVPSGHRENIRAAMSDYFKESDITALQPRRIRPDSMKLLMVWIMTTSEQHIEEEGAHIVQFLSSLHFPYKIEQNPDRF